jgi:hypothetical protein
MNANLYALLASHFAEQLEQQAGPVSLPADHF